MPIETPPRVTVIVSFFWLALCLPARLQSANNWLNVRTSSHVPACEPGRFADPSLLPNAASALARRLLRIVDLSGHRTARENRAPVLQKTVPDLALDADVSNFAEVRVVRAGTVTAQRVVARIGVLDAHDYGEIDSVLQRLI